MSYNIIACEPYSQQWHAARRGGFGGSDAAKALGLSKWGTPYSLYLEKRGEADPVEETWEMQRGKALEPLLRQTYANTTGRNVLLPAGLMQSTRYPFMFYNPDGLTEDARLVEFKTAQYGKEWGDVESDEIPQEYLLQVQHGLIVTALEVCDVTASIAGHKPKPFTVEADKELQQMIIDGEAELWDKIQRGVEPDPVSIEDVNHRFRQVLSGAAYATEEIMNVWRELKAVRTAIKDHEERKEGLDIAIKNFMAEKDVLVHPDTGEILCTWKARKGSERINSKRLRDERPEIAAQYTETGEPTRTFLVK